MTDLSVVTAVTDQDGAVQVADAAARAAGVSVREVAELSDLEQVVALFSDIWARSANPPMPLELLRAFSKAGNYVAAAFEGGTMVGACVGFFHAPSEDALHSHIAGLSRAATGRSIGFALKLHQRAWAIGRGVSEVAWTFDPLVARNAYFNLTKLGAIPDEYLPNFYGSMTDGINAGDDSDRLLVRWRLREPLVALTCAGAAAPPSVADELARGAVVALSVDEDGEPVVGRLDGAVSLVAVPADIERVRATAPALAQRWRIATREALMPLVAAGGRIEGFDRTGWYVVRRR
ncbi:MAG: GNAT family N-acetyltransferase [Nocardioides sp.]